MKTSSRTVGFGGGITDVKLTVESISRMPRLMRWGLYAFAAALVTGVAPMALSALLIWLCGVVGWWLAVALLGAVGCVLWRVMWS